MKRLLSFLLVILFAASTRPTYAQRTTVGLISTGESATDARLRAELRTMGFAVVELTEGEADAGIVGLIQMAPDGSALEVWVRDPSTDIVVLRDRIERTAEEASPRAAWVIRTVESMRAALIRVGVLASNSQVQSAKSEPANEPIPHKLGPRINDTRHPPAPLQHNAWSAEAGGAALLAQGGSTPALLASAGASFAPDRSLGIRLTLGFPVVPSRFEEQEGKATLEPYEARLGGWWTWPSRHVSPFVSGGVHTVWLRMRGEAATDYDSHTAAAWLFGPWAGAGLRMPLSSQLTLRTEATLTLSLPRRDVLFAD